MAPEDPSPLTPSMLITGRDYQEGRPPDEFDDKTVNDTFRTRCAPYKHVLAAMAHRVFAQS